MVPQRLPADYNEKLPIFCSYCREKIADKHLQPSHIKNMDEELLTTDIQPSKCRKAGVIDEEPHGNETDSDDDERQPGGFFRNLARLFISDTEDEDFDGFLDAN